MTATERLTEKSTDKVSLPTLTAMVVGSMIGSGVFLLPRRFGVETGVLGAIIAWTIAGAGMLMLAFVFQRLAMRKPDLDAGIFAYAKAGFGDYVGFNSAIGYWASACAGNTSYWVLITATMSAVVPAFGAGDTVFARDRPLIGVWLFCYLVLRGVKDAAVINYIVTVAKVVPILVFIVIAIIAFKADVFADNFWGGRDYSFSSVWDQATGTMLITVFVFLGIEGASVYSRMARKREDVGRATVIGFLSVLCVFALVTLVSYGVMPQGELAERQPTLDGRGAGIHCRTVGIHLHPRRCHRVGARGLPRVDVDGRRGPLHSRQDGRHAEIPGPHQQSRRTRHCVGHGSGSDLTVAGRTAVRRGRARFHAGSDRRPVPDSLPPRGRVRAEAGATRETYGDGKSLVPDMVIAAVATIYTLFLIYAAGVDKLLLSCILYAPPPRCTSRHAANGAFECSNPPRRCCSA